MCVCVSARERESLRSRPTLVFYDILYTINEVHFKNKVIILKLKPNCAPLYIGLPPPLKTRITKQKKPTPTTNPHPATAKNKQKTAERTGSEKAVYKLLLTLLWRINWFWPQFWSDSVQTPPSSPSLLPLSSPLPPPPPSLLPSPSKQHHSTPVQDIHNSLPIPHTLLFGLLLNPARVAWEECHCKKVFDDRHWVCSVLGPSRGRSWSARADPILAVWGHTLVSRVTCCM